VQYTAFKGRAQHYRSRGIAPVKQIARNHQAVVRIDYAPNTH
jgi:hypothetical protein